MEILKRLYRDPLTNSLSFQELYKKAIAIDNNITLKLVKYFLDNQYSAQIHKAIIKPKIYFSITASRENEITQIDLMDVNNLNTKNKGIKWLFVCVDVFSRKSYVFPMKDKTTKNILLAFNHFLLKVIPQRIMCDNGSEFTSNQFVKLCKYSNI